MPTTHRGRCLLVSQLHRVVVHTQKKSITTKVRPYSEIPGPKPIPLLGNVWRFMPVIGTFNMSNVPEWSNLMYKQYGEIVRISNLAGKNDMLLVYDPESFEKVFRNEGPWPTRMTFESIKYFREKVRGDFFEGYQGIVNENGEKWQKARSVINQPMMQPKVVKQYAAKIDQVAIDFVKNIPALRDEKCEMPDDFSNEVSKWALEAIALTALDARLGCLDLSITKNSDPQKMIHATNRLVDLGFELDMKIPFWRLFNTPKLKEYVEQANIMLDIALKYVNMAQEKLNENTPEEERSVLQKILKRDPSTKRAVIMATDMISAGIDTTARTVAMVLYHLARNPECQERLYSELSQVIPAGSSAPLTAEQIDSMKYLKACIKETMRLNPVAPGNIRCLDKEIVLNNYLIPANTDILMMNGAICTMDKFFAEANRYLPERWLRDDEDNTYKATHHYVYLPFGHGPRQCAGMRFANLEMETLVARMILNYHLDWNYPELTFVTKLVQLPNEPLKFKITDRQR